MAAVTVRNIPEATHRAVKQRAKLNGVSTEAEIRNILEQAVMPVDRIKLGSWLYERSRAFGGVDLDITRDATPIEAAEFE